MREDAGFPGRSIPDSGWRCTLWARDLPADTKGWRGQCAYIVAGHRVHARVEDVIRTGKDTGLGHFPSRDYGLNKAWLDASMTACILLSWLRHLALGDKLAKAEPKTLRYRIFHTAGRLVRGGRPVSDYARPGRIMRRSRPDLCRTTISAMSSRAITAGVIVPAQSKPGTVAG